MVELDAIIDHTIDIMQDVFDHLPMTIRGSMRVLTHNIDYISDIWSSEGKVLKCSNNSMIALRIMEVLV